MFTPSQNGNVAPAQSYVVGNSLNPGSFQAVVAPYTPGSGPSPAPTGSPGGIVLTPSSLAFLAAGTAYAQNFTVSESGYSGSFTATSNNTAIATVASAGSTTFTVTPWTAGSTTVSVSDSKGHVAQLAVGVTISGVTLQGRKRSP
jgi:hypothetical protein